jgi:hypothetical protein
LAIPDRDLGGFGELDRHFRLRGVPQEGAGPSVKSREVMSPAPPGTEATRLKLVGGTRHGPFGIWSDATAIPRRPNPGLGRDLGEERHPGHPSSRPNRRALASAPWATAGWRIRRRRPGEQGGSTPSLGEASRPTTMFAWGASPLTRRRSPDPADQGSLAAPMFRDGHTRPDPRGWDRRRTIFRLRVHAGQQGLHRALEPTLRPEIAEEHPRLALPTQAANCRWSEGS